MSANAALLHGGRRSRSRQVGPEKHHRLLLPLLRRRRRPNRTAEKRQGQAAEARTKQGKSTHHAGIVLAQCVEAVELIDVLVVILAIDSRDGEGQGRRGWGCGDGWCGSGSLKQGSQN